jgi:hypothetical protein
MMMTFDGVTDSYYAEKLGRNRALLRPKFARLFAVAAQLGISLFTSFDCHFTSTLD